MEFAGEVIEVGTGSVVDDEEFAHCAVGEFFDIGLWTEGAKLVYQGARGVLWSKLWGGTGNGGLMVNASLTWQTTDRMDNGPHVVYL